MSVARLEAPLRKRSPVIKKHSRGNNNMKLRKTALWMLSAAAFSAPALAAPGAGLFHFGAGVSSNDAPGTDTGTGYQIFGGYSFGEVARNFSVDAEVGYMNSGEMDVNCPFFANCGEVEAKGLWATGVGRFALNPQFDLIGRAGADFGDDDGFMIGIGGGFNVNKQVQLRLEYVERDNIDSLQFNFVYRP